MIHAQESGHWYDKDGKPVWSVEGAKGQPVTPDVRHARKLGLYPGVTTIIRQAAAPGLELWKQRQVLLSAMTLPRLPEQSEDDWMRAVARDAKEQGLKAAERGTAIHKAIQNEELDGDYGQHVIGAMRQIDTWATDADPLGWLAEQAFAHPLGFGGKTDLAAPNFVADFKTKEFDDPIKVDVWDEHAIQLAAYREGLGMPTARCAIVYVSVTVPGLAKVIEIPEDKLARGWAMFLGLLAYWKAKNSI